jgi:GPH family glycoside/pentoside/hexuronide:cation symporter
MTNPAPRHVKLPLRTRIFSGVGTAGFGIKDQGFAGLLMLYYNQVLGVPAALVGLAIMIAMVVDAFFDPIVGHISDNWRSRWGRRHPFMYAAAVPLSLFYLFLWLPPSLGTYGLWCYLLVMAVLVRLALSVYEIPSMALLSELTTDYHERTSLVAWRYFFGAIGGIGIMAISYKYFFVSTPEHPVGQLNPQGYHIYAYVASVVIFLSVVAAAIGTHNRIPYLHGERNAPILKSPGAFGRAIREVLSNKAYLVSIVSMLLLSVAAGVNNALALYINTYFWELKTGQLAALSGIAIVGVLLAFIVALPVSMKLGKKRGALALFTFPFLFLMAPVIIRLFGGLPATSPILMPILMTASLVYTTTSVAGSILLVAMISDVGDQIRLDSGQRSEGLLFSLVVLINKAISGVGVMFAGALLSIIGFPDHAQPGQVPAAAVHALATNYMIIYLSFVILGLLILTRYPITQKQQEETVRRLRELEDEVTQDIVPHAQT